MGLAAEGMPMPKGHPKTKVQIEDAACELTKQKCLLASNCPLRQLGKQAPKVALFVLPMAITLLQTTSLNMFGLVGGLVA